MLTRWWNGTLQNGSLLVSLFVDQMTPDMKHFNQCFLGWHGKLIDEILIIATFVYNGRDEEKIRQERKQQEEKAGLLAAALQGRNFTGQRGNNGNKGNGNLNWRSPKDCCNKTKILERECPVILRRELREQQSKNQINRELNKSAEQWSNQTPKP